jgi:glycosyltransferase involved in cell wall biosynthesis
MKPTVSVIIPTYNYSMFLRDAIRSVQEQTLSDWECIVVDDGSTDDTREIVEAVSAGDPRVRYFYQENKGLSAARNKGSRESIGDFLQFLDSDDLIERRKLELQAGYLIGHPDVDIVYSDARYFATERPSERLYSKDGRNRAWMSKASGRGREILPHLIRCNLMVVSSPLIRRKVIETCGLFDESLRAHEDWDYWIRCALNDVNFAYLDHPETFTLIRYHVASMSMDPFLMLRTNREILRKLEAFLNDVDLKSANEEMAKIDLLLAGKEIRYGNKVNGLRELLKLVFRHRKLLVNFYFGRLRRAKSA